MVFEPPRIDFVPIDVRIIAVSSACTVAASQCSDASNQYRSDTGGGQRCTGSQVDATNCPDFDVAIPWLDKKVNDSSGSTKSSAPKNIVGFDMTFDK